MSANGSGEGCRELSPVPADDMANDKDGASLDMIPQILNNIVLLAIHKYNRRGNIFET